MWPPMKMSLTPLLYAVHHCYVTITSPEMLCQRRKHLGPHILFQSQPFLEGALSSIKCVTSCHPPFTRAQHCLLPMEIHFPNTAGNFLWTIQLPCHFIKFYILQSFHRCYNTVKINKQNPHLNGDMRLEERPLMHVTQCWLTGRDALASPTGNDTSTSAGEGKVSCLPSNSSTNGRPPELSQWEVTVLWTADVLQWILPLQQSLLSPYKSVPLLCFSKFAHSSPLNHGSQIAILCCSQVNTLCWRNSWLFLKKSIMLKKKRKRKKENISLELHSIRGGKVIEDL